MKDEIKEILDFKEDADYKKLSIEDILLLKECITNLQEDLKYQKEMYDEYCDKHTKLMQEYSNLKKENARLKETVENLTTMTVCGDRKQIKNTAQYKLDICKSRIDKAIEYIEQWRDYKTKRIDSRLKGTLNILQGSDKE